MSVVMGRPYQIQEAKPYLLPLHPQCLPFDLGTSEPSSLWRLGPAADSASSTGVIAHVELQTIIGQVMDTFRDRLYGLSCASDEMPSQVVMKVRLSPLRTLCDAGRFVDQARSFPQLFNSRMDEWKARWCPVPGEPIANNLQLYHHASKLFLNTIPLHTMLRNGDACDDPDSVSSTISSAKSLLSLGHAYAELGVLRHCPDVRFPPSWSFACASTHPFPPTSHPQVNFLFMLYSTVFLVKVRVSNSRFAQLVDPLELESQLLQLMKDCQEAAQGDPRHAAMTCFVIVRALGASWKALETGAGGVRSRGTSIRGDEEDPAAAGGAGAATGAGASQGAGSSGFTGVSAAHVPLDPTLAATPSGATTTTTTNPNAPHLPNVSLAGAMPPSPAPLFAHPFAGVSTPGANPFSNPFAASSAAATPVPAYAGGGGGERRPGTLSGAQTPSAFVGSGMFDGAPLPAPQGPVDGVEGVDHFLNDTHFFGSVLVGRGASGFFDWP